MRQIFETDLALSNIVEIASYIAENGNIEAAGRIIAATCFTISQLSDLLPDRRYSINKANSRATPQDSRYDQRYVHRSQSLFRFHANTHICG